MDWFELTVSIPVESVDTAAAVCQMVVPYGIYIEDYSDLEEATLEIAHIDLIDEELLARDRTKAVIHIYISPSENPQEALSFVCERLESEQIPYETSLGDVREEDWSSAWKSFYKPTRIGQRLVVVPTWENYAPQSGDILLLSLIHISSRQRTSAASTAAPYFRYLLVHRKPIAAASHGIPQPPAAEIRIIRPSRVPFLICS